MFSDFNFTAAVFIGGMGGIVQEFDLLSNNCNPSASATTCGLDRRVRLSMLRIVWGNMSLRQPRSKDYGLRHPVPSTPRCFRQGECAIEVQLSNLQPRRIAFGRILAPETKRRKVTDLTFVKTGIQVRDCGTATSPQFQFSSVAERKLS